MSDCAFFNNQRMALNPALDTLMNYQLDYNNTLWHECHLTAFHGIKKEGMYGVNTLKVTYKEIRTA
jgi:hypothetical protein